MNPTASCPGQRLVLGLLLSSLLGAGSSAWAQDPQVITLNGSRVYRITPQTGFRVDGVPVTAAQAAAQAAGYSALVEATNVPAGVNDGDAQQVDFDNLVRGPVTSLAPLAVLQQPLTITGDTVLVGLTDTAELAVGDLVEVSGFLDANAGAIATSRLARVDNPARDWKLTGLVSQAAANGFAIGAQQVDSSGVTALGCAQGVIDGVYVELESLPDPTYVAGAVLGQLTALECEDPNFGDPPPGATPVSLEGVISALPDPLPDPPSFELLGITVQATAQTEYRAGGIDDLDVGVRVEAEGSFDAATQVLSAREIRFTQAQARFIAPLDPAAVSSTGVTIMGNFVAFTAQTRDEDGIAAGGLAELTQVEVRAFVAADGGLHASRLRERGNPDAADTRLQGPVAEINEPELLILGNSVDTSAATLRDHEGNLLTSTEFYALLRVGMVVSAEDALYDPVSASLIPLSVHLEDAPAAPARSQAAGSQGYSRGTVSALGGEAPLYADGFE